MKTVLSRAGSFRTGDAIADAIVRYGLELARHQQVDVVDFPFVEDGGAARRVQMTVGWLTEIAAVTSGDNREELSDGELVEELAQRARALGAHGDAPFTDPPTMAHPDDF